ncbi:hypothetical protein CDD82_6010 [Ophiocordyceps australis]|uniref:Uncharacterized protein n=1 Tax=Ophiocordyceps australis TaxID=1399860 RepID=A0A2C5ZRJ0_9HYPO|nr:hypothetical protein CDD82_6010 [Ophiocordyceps australis]
MQGFNMGRYHPPDSDSSCPPGRRKPPQTPTVRFEMPFAIWCSTCAQPTLIGQGVRFNARKKRVGAYYSTPVYRFSMRHGECGGEIEIETEPARTDYVVVTGGRRRDYGHDAPPSSPPIDKQSAFSTLERTIAHRSALAASHSRIQALAEAQDATWSDPYARNQRLRAALRPARRERLRQRLRDAQMAQLAPDLVLLDPSEEDARQAALVEFGAKRELSGHETDVDWQDAEPRLAADKDGASMNAAISLSPDAPLAKPLFHNTSRHASSLASANPSRHASSLASAIASKTRLAHDPFVQSASAHFSRRKKPHRKHAQPEAAPKAGSSSLLVQYDSD